MKDTADAFFQKEPLGELKKDLKLPKNCRINKAVLKVRGIGYEGKIKPDLQGVSSMPVGKEPSDKFIIDFHGFRNIIGFSNKVANKNLKKVQQWGGVRFLEENVMGSPLVKADKILVTFEGDVSHESFKKNFEIHIISYPSNLTSSLEGEIPFWSYPGELTREVATPDFSEKMKEFIDACKSKDYCTVPLIFRSDSPGSLEIAENIDYNLIWKYDLKKINFEKVEKKSEVVEIKSSKSILQLIKIAFSYKGKFSDEFIDDNLSNAEEKISVKISPGMSIGLKIQPSFALKATGIDLYLLKKSKDATFFAEIVEDQNGKPSEGAILASKNVNLSSQPEQGMWTSIKFDDALLLDKKTYWFILKAGIGEMEWFCSASEKRHEGFIFKKEFSTHWIPYYATGYFKLMYLPESEDIASVGIEILGQKVDLRPTTESQAVNLNFDDAKISVNKNGMAQVEIKITSKTSGVLELSDIVIEGKEVV